MDSTHISQTHFNLCIKFLILGTSVVVWNNSWRYTGKFNLHHTWLKIFNDHNPWNHICSRIISVRDISTPSYEWVYVWNFFGLRSLTLIAKQGMITILFMMSWRHRFRYVYPRFLYRQINFLEIAFDYKKESFISSYAFRWIHGESGQATRWTLTNSMFVTQRFDPLSPYECWLVSAGSLKRYMIRRMMDREWHWCLPVPGQISQKPLSPKSLQE